MRFHTNLPVASIPETVAFYSTLFNEEPVKLKADYVKFLPTQAGLNISFHQDDGLRASENTLARVHLGFEMLSQEELDAAYSRLAAAGLISVQRETGVCCYAAQDKFWVKDPDGYEWELYVLLEDTEKKIEAKTKCCPSDAGPKQKTSCC